MKLHGFNPGANLTILNTWYKKYRDDDGKYKDVLGMVFKDNELGLKYKEEFENPEFTYYTAKPDKRTSYNRLFIPKDDAIEHKCSKMELDKSVAKELNLSDWYWDCVKSGDYNRVKELHEHPDVFGTDINIEDLYRFQFAEDYVNAPCQIDKSYFDIEADTISMVGDFPEPGECPINAISIVLEKTMQVYTLLLRNHNNPQIDEFEKFIVEEGFDDLKRFIINHANERSPELANEYQLDKFEFNMIFYDEDKELELIRDFFKLVNKKKPDFVLAWNMSFDIPYIIQRIINLGGNPADIMCHKDFKHKFAEYIIDERNRNNNSERGDYAVISGYTVYMDQMIQYASRRKGTVASHNVSLDFVGNAVAKIGKLDYKHITTNISHLPYKDYKTFVYYNIMDTIVQYCIEHVTGDIDYVFGKSLSNNTRYCKVHRQTTYLTNRGKKEFLHSDGLIIGNNFNKNNEKPTTKFPGAFVADPMKVSNVSKMQINGRFINCFNNLLDSDYTSLYPSLIRQYNIAANTQVGKVIIDEPIHNKENRRHDENWDRAGSFFEDFHTQNWIIVGAKWFNLPGVEALYDYVYNYFNTRVMPTNMYGFKPIDVRREYYQPIRFLEEGYSPIIFHPVMNTVKVGEWRNYVEQHPNQQF